jgi:bloom syndrome protein
VEDVRKSDMYGSVSSLLQVNNAKATILFSGSQTIVMKYDFALISFFMVYRN